jgi:hypothetical protein
MHILAKELDCVAPGPVATELLFAGKDEEVVKCIAEVNPMGKIKETNGNRSLGCREGSMIYKWGCHLS